MEPAPRPSRPPLPDRLALLDDLRRLAEASSPEAFDALAETLGVELLPFIERNLDRRLLRRVEPRDVFQEVCIRLYGMRERFVDQGDRAAWAMVYRIARNEIARVSERNGAARRDVRAEESAPSGVHDAAVMNLGKRTATTPSRAMMRDERARMVNASLDELPEADRQLIRILDYDQLGTEEAARRLGLSRDAIRVRHYRALKRLRERLATRMEELSG